ncbi:MULTISPECIES: rod shape-determining protein MreD [Rhodanobacter]|uniref:Rod shape-determining protein MreD n=2 Tax=Rhodanobacter denitrificans TaxID=666685 RepID=M4NDN6_9GAMM|nr:MULTISPECIES: rod shape-determining protein MreD [Rhodanobacter]AGG87568.1 rod shape-determining protein MreD [Rhodanobacter denitrificans]KZC20611.1 rod shape-determining protein MreD [Rhodanobacter denitrificans]UJJ51483.1 rod shape-determining protein MreD [Rhodanobacter denitrificans]UJM86743.1 rod shape-determining protein MreD [Rhodanobacter denitrificans]UJM90199.1 rod shape-determining protein MreD [Rhodanobacter denitrificans]
MNRQRLSLWWFVGTLVFALVSMLVPLPGVLEPFKPYWPALVLLYWSLESEDRVTLGLAFSVGLAADLINGVVLGEQALRLCALAFIALRFRSRLRFFPMWQQALAVLALLLNDRILLLIVRVLAGASLPPASWWISPFVGAALWPFLFLLLDDLRARLRIQ